MASTMSQSWVDDSLIVRDNYARQSIRIASAHGRAVTPGVGHVRDLPRDRQKCPHRISTPQAGNGLPCEAANGENTGCAEGDGDCPVKRDCRGEWSRCDRACKQRCTQRTEHNYPQCTTSTLLPPVADRTARSRTARCRTATTARATAWSRTASGRSVRATSATKSAVPGVGDENVPHKITRPAEGGGASCDLVEGARKCSST